MVIVSMDRVSFVQIRIWLCAPLIRSGSQSVLLIQQGYSGLIEKNVEFIITDKMN